MNSPFETRLDEQQNDIEEEIESIYGEYGDEPDMPKHALKKLNELRTKLEDIIDMKG